MNFNEFFHRVSKLEVSIAVPSSGQRDEISNDALFQLPLIALVILILSKDKRKPRVAEIGQFVGETLETCMPAFKGTSQKLGWSATLRIRTVTALGFLEQASLVTVDNRKGKVAITELGKRVVERAISNEADDLSYNLSRISRSYRNLCVARQLDLVLE